MKILIITQYFWPEQFRINDLVRLLRARGHEVSVLTGMPNYPSGRLFDGYRWWTKRRDAFEGVPVFRVPLFVRRQGRGWQLALNYLSYVVSACMLGPWLLRGRAFDAILVFAPSPFTVGIPAALLRRIKHAPVLFWVQDLWPESLQAAGGIRSPGILRAVGRMVAWIYRRCDRVLVQSKGFIEPAVAAGAERGRIRYLPNWAEDYYRPVTVEEDAPERREMPQGFRIMFAGNLGEAQSLETIVAAAERLADLPDIQWIMIGDGRRKAWMEQQVEKLGLEQRFHFLGRRPAEQMPRYFALADALLVTLRKDPVFALTIPSKIQSYLACGRPILAALDGEGAGIIREAAAGLAVPAGDDKALAEAVRSLHAMSAEERRAMGASGRAFFEREFMAEKLVDRLEGWMNELVKEGRCEF